MINWMSKRGKDAWQFLFWFFLFTYIPIIPAYYLMSLRGLLGLSSLVYVILSWSMIYIAFIRFEKYKNMEKSIKPI
jgi:hypothetical protein